VYDARIIYISVARDKGLLDVEKQNYVINYTRVHMYMYLLSSVIYLHHITNVSFINHIL